MSKALQEKIRRWLRPEVRALKAYHVPPPRELVKLDAMENPYRWPPEMLQAWLEVLRAVPVNRYPDAQARALNQAMRAALGLPADQALMFGNGSDELIQIILTAVAQPGRTVLAPAPTFVMYAHIAATLGLKFVDVPLNADFSLDRPALLAAIQTQQPAVVFLAYPNNPTGNLFAAADIEAVVAASPGLVVVDEAYHAFAQTSFLDRLGRFDNLLVMRTLSKQGLAGLRLGMLAGPPEWLVEFDKVRLPYNINSLTQASAAFALQHRAVLDAQAERLRADRERLFSALKASPGVQAWPSQANFILFKVAARPAAEVFDGLLKRGVLIKNVDGAHPLLGGCLRVTVGSAEENQAFLAALRAVVIP